MTTKRILIFIPCLTNGGAEKQGIILAKALKEHGHLVTVWAFPPINNIAQNLLESLKHKKIEYFQLPSWPALNWGFAEKPFSLNKVSAFMKEWLLPLYKFKKTIPSGNFDIVIPFTFYPCLITSLFYKQFQADIIFWNHRGGFDNAGISYSSFLIHKIMKAKPVFIANSKDGARFLNTTFRLTATKAHVVKNAFVPDSKEELLIPPKRVINGQAELLQLANFFGEKDINTLIDGMDLLKQGGVNCLLHLAGFFPNPATEIEFRNKIAETKTDDLIIYHGALNKESTFRLLAKVHIGILSSKSEGMPNAVMEYMFWKLPVVATNISGIRDLLGEHQQDCLFEVGSDRGFAEKVQWLISDKTRLEKLGNENYERIMDKYSIEKIITQWLNLIELNCSIR